MSKRGRPQKMYSADLKAQMDALFEQVLTGTNDLTACLKLYNLNADSKLQFKSFERLYENWLKGNHYHDV
jgi:hypothetical protein